MVMLLITVKCSGCKKEGDYIVSQEQHSAPCQFCPQHVSFNFKEGLVIDGL